MSILEDYDKRCGREPLTPDCVLEHVEASERYLERADETFAVEVERVVCWLHDHLQAVYEALDNPIAPVEARCAWCFRAGGGTDEAWRALPKMNMEDSAAHAQVCEHNPLVQLVDRQRQELHALQAANADIQGRVFDVDLRDAIHALLKTESTAGQLRRALAELVR